MLFVLSLRKGHKTGMAWQAQEITKNQRVRWSRATKSGQVVSVDMMHSPTPGLVAQLSRLLTNKHSCYASVFVYHYSGAGYVHLQRTQLAEKTLEGKACFERHCQLMGHKVLHYHANNSIFATKAWQESCAKSGQIFTYSGVSAHFQTGVAA
jgi:hypothetical protein